MRDKLVCLGVTALFLLGLTSSASGQSTADFILGMQGGEPDETGVQTVEVGLTGFSIVDLDENGDFSPGEPFTAQGLLYNEGELGTGDPIGTFLEKGWLLPTPIASGDPDNTLDDQLAIADRFFDLAGRGLIITSGIIVLQGTNSWAITGGSGEFADSAGQVTMAEAQIAYTDPIGSGNLRVTFPFNVLPTVSFEATPSGAQEVPPITSSASGSASLTLNQDNTLSYDVTTNGLVDPIVLTTSAAHIHMAPAGENGDIVFDLDLASGSTTDWSGTTPALTVEQIGALSQERLYINVHTEANVSGELRGQIVSAED